MCSSCSSTSSLNNTKRTKSLKDKTIQQQWQPGNSDNAASVTTWQQQMQQQRLPGNSDNAATVTTQQQQQCSNSDNMATATMLQPGNSGNVATAAMQQPGNSNNSGNSGNRSTRPQQQQWQCSNSGNPATAAIRQHGNSGDCGENKKKFLFLKRGIQNKGLSFRCNILYVLKLVLQYFSFRALIKGLNNTMMRTAKEILDFARKSTYKCVCTCIFNPTSNLWNCANNPQLRKKSAIVQIFCNRTNYPRILQKSSSPPEILQISM